MLADSCPARSKQPAVHSRLRSPRHRPRNLRHRRDLRPLHNPRPRKTRLRMRRSRRHRSGTCRFANAFSDLVTIKDAIEAYNAKAGLHPTSYHRLTGEIERICPANPRPPDNGGALYEDVSNGSGYKRIVHGVSADGSFWACGFWTPDSRRSRRWVVRRLRREGLATVFNPTLMAASSGANSVTTESGGFPI